MAWHAAEIEVGGLKEQPMHSHVSKAFSFHTECRHLEPIFRLGLKERLEMAQAQPSHGDYSFFSL